MEIILANIKDLDFLESLENENFSATIRSSRNSLRNSINSPNQRVFVIRENEQNVGSMIIMLYAKQIRIYSIAVRKDQQGKGFGKALMKFVVAYAVDHNVSKVVLEANAEDEDLIEFYEQFGFYKKKLLLDYYGQSFHGVKMVLSLQGGIKNIVITDFETDFFQDNDLVLHITAKQYIEEITYQELKNAHIFNFCQSVQYQTIGYYVSLLALARNQKIYPSLAIIRDYKNKLVVKSMGEEEFDLMQTNLAGVTENKITMDSYFGYCDKPKYKELIKHMDQLFEAPLIRYEFRKNIYWQLDRVSLIPLNQVKQDEEIKKNAKKYFSQKRFNQGRFKNYEYDMAILIDEHEENPPSNQAALKKCKIAAEKCGFYVEFISKKDYRRIPEFDALFIRTTTNVNNYTYDFAKYAYSEGLVVMDDPWSILGCSNKLFLFEKMKLNKVKIPTTWLLSKKSKIGDILNAITYPVILKQPDSAFSLGVHKARDKEECKALLGKLFQTSELIIAQEFMPTEFDWRIGVLDGKPIFACKYYMAKGHWQILNWNENNENKEGAVETIPIDKVPFAVIKAAIKAAMLIGDGLYGVDIKVVDGLVNVIEVNDNPNIDSGVEDSVAGPALYEQIMELFYNRIENSRNIIRYTTK